MSTPSIIIILKANWNNQVRECSCMEIVSSLSFSFKIIGFIKQINRISYALIIICCPISYNYKISRRKLLIWLYNLKIWNKFRSKTELNCQLLFARIVKKRCWLMCREQKLFFLKLNSLYGRSWLLRRRSFAYCM